MVVGGGESFKFKIKCATKGLEHQDKTKGNSITYLQNFLLSSKKRKRTFKSKPGRKPQHFLRMPLNLIFFP